MQEPQHKEGCQEKVEIRQMCPGCAWTDDNHGPPGNCRDPECMSCAVLECPKNDPLHLHHDWCPSCDK